MEIFKTDVRTINEFDRVGYHYTKIESNDSYMIWEMSKEGKCYGYELWKPKWKKNPDGTKVWAKPSDEDFGTYGWYNTNIERLRSKIES